MTYINLNAATKNDRAAALNNDIGNAAYITIYTGSAPSSPDVAATGTPLVTLPCSTPFGTVSNAVLTAGPITSNTAVNTGVAGYGRLFTSAGVAKMDLDVGTSGAAIIVPNTTMNANTTISCNGLSITEQ